MSKVRDLFHAIDYENMLLEEFFTSLDSIDNVAYVDPAKVKALKEAVVKVRAISDTFTGDESWEDIALYFADCEAATAYTYGSTKSMSMYETKRHISICQTMLSSIEAGALVGKSNYLSRSKKEHVIEQLRKVIDTCQNKVDNQRNTHGK